MDPVTASGPAGRLLTLLSLLQGRREWAGPELARRLGVSPRTVRRDVDRLRELGYPIDSVGGRAGRYTLRAGTAMPPLLLDDDEAVAIAVGLRTAAASASIAGIDETALRALVKLEQVLPPRLRRRVRALGDATTVLGSGGGPLADPTVLSTLAAAARDHAGVRLVYRGGRGAATRRTVEPHALVSFARLWYLVAFDPSRGGWRTFRVDRIQRTSAAARFTPRPIPGRSAEAFVRRSLSELTGGHEVQVTYDAPAAVVREALERVRDPAQVTEVDARTCTRRVVDHDLDWLAMRIAIPGVPFSVRGSPEVLEHLRAMGERFLAAVGERRVGSTGPVA